jgi:drug/metabolite transporter (DMT)-like permease
VLLLGESITVSAVVGLVMIVAGAEITLRGAGDRRSRGDVRARYEVHPPFH